MDLIELVELAALAELAARVELVGLVGQVGLVEQSVWVPKKQVVPTAATALLSGRPSSVLACSLARLAQGVVVDAWQSASLESLAQVELDVLVEQLGK